MECPNCGHQNAEDAKFCSRCGTGLRIECPVCSFESAADARFCSNCGSSLTPTGARAVEPEGDLSRYLPEELLTKLRSARAGRAMHGERRTVTMLFADIAGSTAAAETLDPEDWAEIVNGAFGHLIAPVYRYEGTLARLAGDAVLAFFGAPIAHEDDPLRAMRAGLAIVDAFAGYREEVRRRWGFPIEVRVGINTGLVVVGEVGSDLRVEYTALGDAINVAARMEQAAQAGTVLVSARTRSLAEDAFEFEDLGAVEVKGKSEPIRASRVIRFVGVPDKARLRPIVGRESERSTLDQLRSRLAGGSGWIVSVIGEAGIGKSRLVQELRSRAEGATPLASRFDQEGSGNWMVGAGRSYESSTPYGTIGSMLRRWWGTEDAEDAFARVDEAIEMARLPDPEDTGALLAHISGIPLADDAAAFIDALETPVLHAKVGDALMAYVAAVATGRPTFLVLEDLHWSDDLTLAAVEQIMDLTDQVALGVVIAMRPYREEPTWRIHQVAEQDHPHRYHALLLSHLAPVEGTALLDSLTAGMEISEDTRRRILERSDGNPLYIEEMVRSLREAGDGASADVAVPDGLSAMLTARLDRLDDGARYVVQLASVLGTDFHRDTLAAVGTDLEVDGRITELMRRELLIDTGIGRLGFRHALMQEAAYETILRRTRRELHRRVADHLVTSHPEAPQEIARHLIEADETDAAFPYLIEAGARATRAMALGDAIRHLNLAIEHTPDDADAAAIVRAHDALGEAYSLVPDLPGAAAAYQRLYDYGEQTSTPSARVAALNRLGFATATLGADLTRAREYLESARALATEAQDDVGLAEYHMNACFVASMAGDVGLAVQHDEQTVALGEKSGVDVIRLEGLVRRAVNYVSLLEFDRAGPAIDTALVAATDAGAEEAVAIVRTMGIGQQRFLEGDPRAALELFDESLPALGRFRSFYWSFVNHLAAEALFELGDPEAALSRLTEARRSAEKTNQAFVAAAAAAGMAMVYGASGVEEPIAQLRADAIRLLDEPMGGFVANTIWAHLGFSALWSGDAELALADFDTGLAVSSITQFAERPRILGGTSAALTRLGRLAEARTTLDEAYRSARSKDVGLHLPLLDLFEAEILLAEDRPEEADELLGTALVSTMDAGRRLLSLEIVVHRTAASVGRGAPPETIDRHRSAAAESITTIASSVADERLRRAFTDKWTSAVDGILGAAR